MLLLSGILLYNYKIIAFLASALICVFIFLPVYRIYRLIICNMNEGKRILFQRVLKITGICIVIILLAELVLSIMVQNQVNRQLGFNYATPETPEGEYFEIIRVDTGSVMEQSGLKLYDRVQMPAVSQLYRLLLNNQVDEVSFMVLRETDMVEIHVQVPAMQVPLWRLAFIF